MSGHGFASSRGHDTRIPATFEKPGIPYLGSGAWSVEVRKIDPVQMKKRSWIARALAVNHLYVVETGEKGWSAEAKTADGTSFDRIERPWRR